MTEGSEQRKSEWMDEAESALERIGDSLRQAWTETREARISTLEAAREAASRLGDAIDQGINVMRDTWSNRPGEAEEDPSADVSQEEE